MPNPTVGVNAETPDLGRLKDYLGFRLRRVHFRLSKGFAERSREYGLKSGELSALAIIEANPGISQTEMARAIDMDASVAVAMITTLKAGGLIRRKRTDEDKRRFSLELTEKGTALLNEVFVVLCEIEDDVLRALAPTELLQFNRLLDRIYHHSS
jgi:DNA-binding MarR family transcriptional regulator